MLLMQNFVLAVHKQKIRSAWNNPCSETTAEWAIIYLYTLLMAMQLSAFAYSKLEDFRMFIPLFKVHEIVQNAAVSWKLP